MTKLSITVLSLVLLFSVFTHSQGQPPKLCPTSLIIPGTCGENAKYECFLAVNAQYGASAMTQKCTCAAAGPNQRKCTCMIVPHVPGPCPPLP